MFCIRGKRAAVAVVLLSLAACGEKVQGPARKPTSPVTGEVYVDGQPVTDLQVTCHDVKGLDKANPTDSLAITDEEGSFALRTYVEGDGVPPGDYVMTFYWGINKPGRGRYEGPDKLDGRYDDPKTSQVKFTVDIGTPTDLGRIELTTK